MVYGKRNNNSLRFVAQIRFSHFSLSSSSSRRHTSSSRPPQASLCSALLTTSDKKRSQESRCKYIYTQSRAEKRETHTTHDNRYTALPFQNTHTLHDPIQLYETRSMRARALTCTCIACNCDCCFVAKGKWAKARISERVS